MFRIDVEVVDDTAGTIDIGVTLDVPGAVRHPEQAGRRGAGFRREAGRARREKDGTSQQ
jgi:hypothetical protein